MRRRIFPEAPGPPRRAPISCAQCATRAPHPVIPALYPVIPAPHPVIPAQAGIQELVASMHLLGPRLREDDGGLHSSVCR